MAKIAAGKAGGQSWLQFELWTSQGWINFMEVAMRHYLDQSVYCSALSPVLSFHDLPPASSDSEGEVTFDIEDPSPTAAEILDNERACQAVHQFVSSLSPRDREIVTSVFWENETQADVARRFGVSRMAISKVMARIYRHGQQHLAAYRDCGLLH